MDGLESTDSGTVVQTHEGAPATSRIDTKHDYLLVFEGDSSRIVMLPTLGEFVIGRDKSCHLMLVDHAISRRHAVITIGPQHVTVRDLESQNGTRLNGERVVGDQSMVSGDAIDLGSITMVLQRHRDSHIRRPIVDLVTFLQRGEEEIDRALRYHRPLSILSIAFTNRNTAPELSSIRDVFRMMDVVGRDGNSRLAVLMPETSREDASAAAKRLIEALGPESVRIGVAACPNHGCEPETLIASARAASRQAGPGEVMDVDGVMRVLEIGRHSIVLSDPAMLRCYDLLERLARSELPILIYGETGTGKEVAAAAVHEWSQRKGPFVAVNCAALAETLLESELFGHTRGAFTGATANKQGTLERAHGGTVFLDELGELSPAAQAKLLRVLETHQLTPVGATTEVDVDLRIVAATHRNLADAVAAGTFRQDLFFRLSGCTVMLPPLRDRPREIPLLAERFLRGSENAEPKVLSDDALHALLMYSWPGNVRELRNLMVYLAATVEGPTVEPIHLRERLGDGVRTTAGTATAPAAGDPARPTFRSIGDELRDLEITRMREALDAAGGNQTRAAALIQMPLRTFQGKAKQYKLTGRTRSED